MPKDIYLKQTSLLPKGCKDLQIIKVTEPGLAWLREQRVLL
jgi:hypothetical protein